MNLRPALAKMTFARVVGGCAVLVLLSTGTAYAANEWTGANIVNDSLTSADIKNNNLGSVDVLDGTLRGVDLAANTVTGVQINESTLGKVPDANTVDGLDSSDLQSLVSVEQGGSYTDVCTAAAQWRECSVVDVVVPPGQTYRVSIDSAGSFLSASENQVELCASVRNTATPFDGTGPTVAGCPNQPTGVSLAAGQMNNAATNGVQTIAGGASGATFSVSTAVRPQLALTFNSAFDYAVLHTLVTVMRVPSGPATIPPPARLHR